MQITSYKNVNIIKLPMAPRRLSETYFFLNYSYLKNEINVYLRF